MAIPNLVYRTCVTILTLLSVWIINAPSVSGTSTGHPLPSFLDTPTNTTFGVGEEAILQCAIQNLGTRTVVWRRASDPNPLTIGDNTYVSDDRIRVLHEKYSMEWSLHIRDVTFEDEGVYECQISSKSRSVRRLIMLRVNEKPSKNSKGPEIEISGLTFVEKGNPLKVTCNATGNDYPPEGLDWFKDGLKITPNDRTSINMDVSISDRTIISTLVILRADMYDAGTYVCRTSDLQITSAKVNVLNTDTDIEKRDFSFDKKHPTASCSHQLISWTLRCYIVGYSLSIIIWLSAS
ncbi:hypothetical protein SNE40_012693 [Patella caerulea]|uniref:Ig-like domain-containing protein n=1 Tax=Patella caerulea TaxID=87958 RepID=A0AAN8JQC3_PATCE